MVLHGREWGQGPPGEGSSPSPLRPGPLGTQEKFRRFAPGQMNFFYVWTDFSKKVRKKAIFGPFFQGVPKSSVALRRIFFFFLMWEGGMVRPTPFYNQMRELDH